MKIEIEVEKREVKGTQTVKFQVTDPKKDKLGTLIVGKGGIRWQDRWQRDAKGKSWNEVRTWLQQHGRIKKK